MRRVKKIIGYTLILYSLLNIFLYFFQESLIFIDTKLNLGFKYDYEVPFEEIFLTAKDGAQLNTLYFKHEKPLGVIVYYHGNAGNLSKWGEIVLPIYELGYDLMIMDYRGYGKSSGERTESLMYDDADLLYKAAQEKFSENEITIYGRSLGSTFATSVAAKYNAKQLILETPFYSLEDLINSSYSFFPVKALLDFRFPTNELINKVKYPITIFHGTKDRIVPFQNARKLMEVAPMINWISIKGGRHNNLAEQDLYWTELKKILK